MHICPLGTNRMGTGERADVHDHEGGFDCILIADG